jgi:hypothetical protein
MEPLLVDYSDLYQYYNLWDQMKQSFDNKTPAEFFVVDHNRINFNIIKCVFHGE